MTQLKWDEVGTRTYETGVDHGVLYIPDAGGDYANGVAWNGLVTVTESPSGAEASPQYADNIKYLNLVSAEQFGATIEAFTYPLEFAQFDGIASPTKGVFVGQQTRKTFGLAYRTLVGNDLAGTDYGYKLHVIYGALAKPTEKAHATVNDSPEAITFSWEITTSPVNVPGLKPSAQVTIDSTQVDPEKLLQLENILYGTAGADPRLPLPSEIFGIFEGSLIEVAPVQPTYNSTTDVLTIPTVTGVVYKNEGVVVTGDVTITKDTVITAVPAEGYVFPEVTDNDWYFDFV